jgi:hypothetical protein
MSPTMIFIIIIFAIVTVGRIVRAGMGLEERKLKLHGRGSDEVSQLERENAALRGKVNRLEDRMAVLERIATDAPARLTAEIEKLRD